MWPIDERAKNPPDGWAGWPEGKKFALVLTHDVDTAKGQERCVQLAGLEEGLGFRSSFNFVAEGYPVSAPLRSYLTERGFEVGVHGLTHNGNPFRSKEVFQKQAVKINRYLKEWGSVGFRSPSMYHNLDWIGELNIDYDASTFDTDPFEPQPDGVGTIFPFWVPRNSSRSGPDLDPLSFNLSPSSSNPELATRHLPLATVSFGSLPPTSNLKPPTSSMGFVELPYTLPQDHALFVIMGEKDISVWKKKLDWIVTNGGMALLNTHPNYMNFDGTNFGIDDYPVKYYVEFINYVKTNYRDQYWHVLPKNMARFWVSSLSTA